MNEQWIKDSHKGIKIHCEYVNTVNKYVVHEFDYAGLVGLYETSWMILRAYTYDEYKL